MTLLYLAAAATAIATPGPGVVLTISNALRHGLTAAFGGILGIATGSLVIAAISATGVGVLLVTSPLLFKGLKVAGALYLVFLAWRLWHAVPKTERDIAAREGASFLEAYRGGVTMQFANPQALAFFIALFPRFLEGAPDLRWRFAELLFGYAALLVLIHGLYALIARTLQDRLAHGDGRIANRAAALAFVGFAVLIVR